MSITITKAGILDTIQDMGRYGYQHLGITPSGAMDRYAAQVANILVGNTSAEAVLEMHFPAPVIEFHAPALIAVAGAETVALVGNEKVPLLHPVMINAGVTVSFQQPEQGARIYMAVQGGFDVPLWLNSYSTGRKARMGGFQGRALQKGDTIDFRRAFDADNRINGADFTVLPWTADLKWEESPINSVNIIPGNEWNWMDDSSQNLFDTLPFYISSLSDRMGYRLNSATLSFRHKDELLSSAISFGAIQLLPDGQAVVLMAGHQTTGGYPRIAHVVSAHLPKLAQMKPGEEIYFELTTLEEAETLLMRQHQHLKQLAHACTLRLQEYFA